MENVPRAIQANLAQQASVVPRFEEKGCSGMLSESYWEGVDTQRFRCGNLFVWEFEDSPSMGTIALPVVVAKRKDSNTSPIPEPVIYLEGGPGGKGISFSPQNAIYLADFFERDFIQFGQRGSNYSNPNFDCPELREAVFNNWKKSWGWTQWSQAESNALEACLDHFQKDSTNRADNFNSQFNARDVVHLIQVLGYERANLYGGSYGTLLAQHILALSPSSVHAVVLDGVVPLGVDFEADFARSVQRSLNEIFKACSTDPDCNKAYLDLEPFFYELVDRLNQEPERISIKDGETTYTGVYMDGYAFLSAFTYLLYHQGEIKNVPRIIYAAGNGNFDEIGQHYYSYQRDLFFAWGMYYSVYCTEFAAFNPYNAGLTGVNPRLRVLARATEEVVNLTCSDYDPQNKSYGSTRVQEKNIPLLIFNGQYDPVTPPSYGDQVANQFSNAYVFLHPTAAHGSTGDLCALNMMKDFFNNPDWSPDRSCWDQLPQQMRFNTRNLEIVKHRFWIWLDLNRGKVETAIERSLNWLEEKRIQVEELIDEQIARFTVDFETFVQEKIVEFETALEEWLIEESAKWLEEVLTKVCGNLGLPVGFVAVLAVRRYCTKPRRL